MNWFKKRNLIVKLLIVGIGLFIGSAIIAGIIGGSTSDEGKEEVNKESVPETDKKEKSEKSKEEPIKEVEEEYSWDDVKEKDRIVGKSDKDFSEVTKSKPNDVRNDTTGKWRILKISENIDIEEYALSYADLHMKDDELHFIVNFNYHTTTWLNKIDGLLFVDIREYVKKEEHDAKKLGNGMVLKSYVIYPDGDIQELDEP